jgi:NitT/TauT family transport system permease protein
VSTVAAREARFGQVGTDHAAWRQRWQDGFTLIVALAVLWQAGTWILGADVLPSPAATLDQLRREVASPDFKASLLATGKAFGTALAISMFGGVALGLALGVRRMAGDVMEPVLFALYSIPKIALYPVILLIFGLGMSAKIAFGTIHGIIPIVIFSMNAVRNIKPVYLRTAAASRLSPLQSARFVLMPACVPEIVAGLRIGFSLTLLGTLVGEMFASQEGIGHRLIVAMNRNEATVIMAMALLLFAFATLVSLLLLQWENRLRRGSA